MMGTDEFEAFFRAEFPRLVLYLRLRGYEQHAADAAQEALAAAYRCWHSIDAPSAWVRSAVLRIAQHHAQRDAQRAHRDRTYAEHNPAQEPLRPRASRGTHRGTQGGPEEDGGSTRYAAHGDRHDHRRVYDRRDRPRARHRRCHRAFASAPLLVDLENLKEVNDTLGRLAGDELLRAAAARMVRGAQAKDLVARLDGGEFAVLLPGVRGQTAAKWAAQCLLDALASAVPVHGVSLDMTVSVGLALYPDDAETFEGMLQRADLARRLNQVSDQDRTDTRKPRTVNTPG